MNPRANHGSGSATCHFPTLGAEPVLVRGFTSSLSTVTVNGTLATPGAGNMFSLNLSLSAGTQTISITASTSGGITTSSSYTVSVSSTTFPSKFVYDANGNTLYDGVNTYDYDAADRLIRIRNGSTVTEFIYDGLGRRVAEWDNGSLAKQWVWAGTELCEERNASDTVTKRFFPQGEQISGTAYFYSRDHLGSIREMTDSSGTIHSRYSYDPYGVRAANTITTSAVESDFGFTGDFYNATFGLDLTLYRVYNPFIGRWLNRDPKGVDGGLDLYGYVGDDPINHTDLFGLDPNDSYLMQVSETWYGYLSGLSLGLLPIDSDDPQMQAGADFSDKVQLALMVVGDEEGAANEAKALKKAAEKAAAKKAAEEALKKKLATQCRDLIRGSLKRSPSYHSELENLTYQELLNDNSPAAKQMKKLIDQANRLMQKNY